MLNNNYNNKKVFSFELRTWEINNLKELIPYDILGLSTGIYISKHQIKNVTYNVKKIFYFATTKKFNSYGFNKESVNYKRREVVYVFPYVSVEERLLPEPYHKKWQACFFDVYCIVFTETVELGFQLSIQIVESNDLRLDKLPDLEEWFYHAYETDHSIYFYHSVNVVRKFCDHYKNGVDDPFPLTFTYKYTFKYD